MIIRRSTSGEVARLLGDLAGADEARREAAVARLSVIGARAVAGLLTAHEAARQQPQAVRQQSAILQTLERIGDARALAPALDMLGSDSSDLHAAAVGVLRAHVQSRRSALANRVLEALIPALWLSPGSSSKPPRPRHSDRRMFRQ